MEVFHLNQSQLANRWDMSTKTLERWRWLGIGPQFLKIGSRVVYRLADIQAYEDDCLRSGTPASEINLPERVVRYHG